MTKTKKLTIRQKVELGLPELKEMKTNKELREWAVANGMDNRAAFPKFKDALLEFGIDYEGIRTQIKEESKQVLQSKITHELVLYTDAKASHSRFAICGADKGVLWYGRFFDNDRDFNGEQSSGELACAKKAVWLATKVKELLKLDALRLTLKVDAQWLCYQDSPKQKGFVLTTMAHAANIDLHVEWIPGTSNPADSWTTESGFQKYDLQEVANAVTAL